MNHSHKLQLFTDAYGTKISELHSESYLTLLTWCWMRDPCARPTLCARVFLFSLFQNTNSKNYQIFIAVQKYLFFII